MSPRPTIVVASRNAHKLHEIQRLFASIPVDFVPVSSFPNAPDVEENGSTFAENALIKARSIRDFTHTWALADDSGLEVDALQGAPGVFSARFAGTHGDDLANNHLLLQKLHNTPAAERTAHFSCAIALVSPDHREWTSLGNCYGQILTQPRGSQGFGYDPLFLPDGFTQTFAELPTESKCSFSHRAKAAEQMLAILKSLFSQSIA